MPVRGRLDRVGQNEGGGVVARSDLHAWREVEKWDLQLPPADGGAGYPSSARAT